MHLERPHGRHQHHRVGDAAGIAAFDVKEFLHAHVRAKAGLGHDVVRQLQGDHVGNDGAVAVRDIGKRSGVHQHGRAFQRLHQVGLDSVFHQHGQRASHAQVVRGDGLLAATLPDNNPPDARAHICQAGGKRQNRHQFARDGNIVIGVELKAFFFRPLPDGNPAQHAVVHVHAAPPGDRGRVNIQPCEARPFFRAQLLGVAFRNPQLFQAGVHPNRKAALAVLVHGAQAVKERPVALAGLMKHARVNCRGKQVVGSRNGVDVPGQMQVEVFHRDDLRIPAAGRPALDAKGGTLRRLADAGEHALPQVRAQRLAEADGRGGFALAQGGRCDGGDVNIFSVRYVLQPLQHVQFYFRLVIPIKLDFIRQQSGFFGHLRNGLQHGRLRDINVRGDGLQQLQARGGKTAQSRFLFERGHIFPLFTAR